MTVAVVSELMPAPEDLLHQRFTLIDDEAGDEEGRLGAVAIQEIEHPAGADLPAIGALRHQDRAPGKSRIAPRPHRFGIEIEGEKEREALAGQWHCETLVRRNDGNWRCVRRTA